MAYVAFFLRVRAKYILSTSAYWQPRQQRTALINLGSDKSAVFQSNFEAIAYFISMEKESMTRPYKPQENRLKTIFSSAQPPSACV